MKTELVMERKEERQSIRTAENEEYALRRPAGLGGRIGQGLRRHGSTAAAGLGYGTIAEPSDSTYDLAPIIHHPLFVAH